MKVEADAETQYRRPERQQISVLSPAFLVWTHRDILETTTVYQLDFEKYDGAICEERYGKFR